MVPLPDLRNEMASWRHKIHQLPETGFQEIETSQFICDRLTEFGIPVHRGLAKTGVVGTLRVGSGNRAIGLRADMDALFIQERTDLPYKSEVPGKMHACGHDGHSAMLLGAAKHLAETRNFNGTIHFIFQPAEEIVGGGKVMVEDGLFDLFPVDAVFGMHNMPGAPAGRMFTCPGPLLASANFFDVKVKGKGVHWSMPHLGVDPVPIVAEIVLAFQRIVSRNISPLDSAVLTVTKLEGNSTINAIPDEASLAGIAGVHLPEVLDLLEKRMRETALGIAAAHNAEATFSFDRRYPPMINSVDETQFAMKVARSLVGEQNVEFCKPRMGAEDFAWMLRKRPGNMIFIGNGDSHGSVPLHNDCYQFNDDILPIGQAYWVALAERFLAEGC